MFYRYEHYMSISHIALIVNMVQKILLTTEEIYYKLELWALLPEEPRPCSKGTKVTKKKQLYTDQYLEKWIQNSEDLAMA